MQHKIILISGVSRGLGMALAHHWSATGNTVIGISRKRSVDLQSSIYFYECDLAVESEVTRITHQILRDFPKIDILINNAAILTSLPVSVMTNNDISRMIDINLKAPILISKLLFRNMLKVKSGQIINILSMASKLNVIGDSVYSATKSGLEAFSKVLNKEGHPFGVHVNNIGISAYPSGMLEKIINKNPQKILALIPHHQFAPLKEIIASIEFFELNSIDIGGQTLYFGGV